MKYVGVARKGEKGIVQVGLEPVRQLEAQEKNTYEYIFSRFPTEEGEEIFAIQFDTNEVLGHSGNVTEEDLQKYYQEERLSGCENGSYMKMSETGRRCYVVTRQYDNVLIGALVPTNVMFTNLWVNLVTAVLYLMVVEVILIILLDYLVRWKVVNGIHGILEKLTDITNGNMDTTVEVGGNPEFEKLSSGINVMVKSIVNTSDRISKIIEMSEIPLAAFEYQSDMKCVFVTSGLGGLINLTSEEMNRLCANPELFYAKIQTIMQTSIENEKDIFQIAGQRYIRIHLSTENGGYLGVITDVTGDVLEKQRIQYENNHDQLTGLLRYRYFKKQIPEILENGKETGICACVMMDLDNFKSINDTYGHDVGDKYLIAFAEMMCKLPEEHCLPSRRSGDEFCIFIYDFETRKEILSV
ncbi:MAG: diguanylate cyclase domain-containing protein, partial [Suilimivivens sp.]